MSLRLPGHITLERASAATGLQPVELEILGEMAHSLGDAERKAEAALRRLRESDGTSPAASGAERERLLKHVAKMVYAYLVQRELCGMKRHDDVIRDMQIPRPVLARLGAS
jgi:hypothetical protein